jgi:glycosyltransferase involved in cell wall biosynthesis
MDAICAIDLDTILPGLIISRLKKIIRIYDAHEFFTELKEVMTRPAVQKAWLWIEKKTVPHFKWGYTVSEGLAREYNLRYGVQYEIIRNVPVLQPLTEKTKKEKILFYQGAVNEARGFEMLIPAMQHINCKLVICGDGNFMPQLKKLIARYGVEKKIELKGMLSPAELWAEARRTYIAIAVPEKEGLNQFLALPNKFFDYLHAGLPQVTVNYPEYSRFNNQYEVAILLDEIIPERIATAVNNLLANDVLYLKLRDNCLKAREIYNWQTEEKKLLLYYNKIFTA